MSEEVGPLESISWNLHVFQSGKLKPGRLREWGLFLIERKCLSLQEIVWKDEDFPSPGPGGRRMHRECALSWANI